MATSFSEKRKRLKYLFSILAIIVFIGILIILVPKLSPTIEPMISPEIETPIKKINIDFEVLEHKLFETLLPFPEIKPIEKEVGRKNPDSPFIFYKKI